MAINDKHMLHSPYRHHLMDAFTEVQFCTTASELKRTSISVGSPLLDLSSVIDAFSVLISSNID